MVLSLATRGAWWCALGNLVLSAAVARYDFRDPGDLTSFVTRPDLKAPKVVVKNRDGTRVTPGYWFVAPYRWPGVPTLVSHYWTPCESGPLIFDNDGHLIWSGACQFNNSAVFGFKPITVDQEQHLTFLSRLDPTKNKLTGFILNNRYEVETSVPDSPDPLCCPDLHEFRVTDDGMSVLLGNLRQVPDAQDDPGRVNRTQGNVFREMDLQSGRTLFEWDSFDHIDHELESTSTWELLGETYWVPIPTEYRWDAFHLNSIDKNADGDYLISARYTDCIYKISGKDGSIIWRLGGKLSDFDASFNFSHQHDARFIESNNTHTTLSFLNNAADLTRNSSAYSSGMVVRLSTAESPMKATLIAQFDRPDRDLTRMTGNVQILPDGGNVIVNWAQGGYVTEFTPDGDCVMEASFMSDRWNVYRAFKSNFSAQPTEPPVLKGFSYGSRPSRATTVFYVSWNGATEVRSWNFYSQADGSSSVLLGNTLKTGFETMFTVDGYIAKFWVEALDGDGDVLVSSLVEETVIPPNWKATVVHDHGAGESTTWEENRTPSILSSFTRTLAHDTQSRGPEGYCYT